MGYQWRHINALTYEDMSCRAARYHYRYYSGHVDFATSTFYKFKKKDRNSQRCRKVSSRVTIKSIGKMLDKVKQ